MLSYQIGLKCMELLSVVLQILGRNEDRVPSFDLCEKKNKLRNMASAYITSR